MIKLRFRPLSSARDKTAAGVASVVSILFIIGAAYFYRVPVDRLLNYLVILVVIALGVIAIALILAAILVIARKLFSNKS